MKVPNQITEKQSYLLVRFLVEKAVGDRPSPALWLSK
jgi:hypothetical protein